MIKGVAAGVAQHLFSVIPVVQGGVVLLSEEKIKKMIRLSDYENGFGSTDLRRVHYDKVDYVRLQALRTAGSVFVALILISLLAGMYYLDDLLYQTFSIRWEHFIPATAAVILSVVVFSIIVTCIKAARAYEESRVRAREYYTTLQELIQIYEKEEQGQEEEAE